MTQSFPTRGSSYIHFQSIGLAGKIHLLNGASRHILQHHGTPAKKIGRSGEDLERRHATVRQSAAKARVLRPDGMLRPDARVERPRHPVSIRMRRHGRAWIIAEVTVDIDDAGRHPFRSEEHTSELPSLMRISYAVFCLTQQTTK